MYLLYGYDLPACTLVAFCTKCKVQIINECHCHGCGGHDRGNIKQHAVRYGSEEYICTGCFHLPRLEHHCDTCGQRQMIRLDTTKGDKPQMTASVSTTTTNSAETTNPSRSCCSSLTRFIIFWIVAVPILGIIVGSLSCHSRSVEGEL